MIDHICDCRRSAPYAPFTCASLNIISTSIVLNRLVRTGSAIPDLMQLNPEEQTPIAYSILHHGIKARYPSAAMDCNDA